MTVALRRQSLQHNTTPSRQRQHQASCGRRGISLIQPHTQLHPHRPETASEQQESSQSTQGCAYILVGFRSPGSSVVSGVQVEAAKRVGAGVELLLPLPGGAPHGVLVHGGVGLGRGVVAWGQAVAGLAAVVAVPVVHGAVLVFQSCRTRTRLGHKPDKNLPTKRFNMLQKVRQSC